MTTTENRMRFHFWARTPDRRAAVAGAAIACALLAGSVAPPAALAQTGDGGAPSQEEQTLDTLILRNGRIVRGRIIDENESEIRIVIIVAGIEAPTTYRRSEILEIHRGARKDKAEKPAKEPAPKPAQPPAGEKPQPRPASAAGDEPVIYLLPLHGHIVGDQVGFEYVTESRRRDIVSISPVEAALKDAMASHPDVIVIEIDADSPAGFDGLFVAQPLYGAVEDVMRQGHRVVFWVRKALAGAAFLPFISPEIYFTSRGQMGGVGNLSDFDIGDEVVNEKQISLRLGIAEGRAIQGGYNPALVRAMARRENWLFVRWEGGEPVYLEHEPRPSDGPGWTLLSDDGEGGNKDASVIDQNDVLQLDADWALRLRVSKGTADSIDDLAFMLGFGRDYRVERGKAKRILEDWSQRVANAADEILRQQELLKEAERGGGQDQRAAIGRQISTLRRIRGMMTVYAEVFDPGGERRAQIDIQIEQLRLEMRGIGSEEAALRLETPRRITARAA